MGSHAIRPGLIVRQSCLEARKFPVGDGARARQGLLFRLEERPENKSFKGEPRPL
jgi:hypothetical protein